MTARVPRVVVFGASGFVGSAVAEALESRGAVVVRRAAPRARPSSASKSSAAVDQTLSAQPDLVADLEGADAAVNAAGNPSATSKDERALIAANAVTAGVIAAACRRASVDRLVHVSSAAVLGDAAVLDDSPPPSTGITPYGMSKMLGERLVVERHPGAVIYRPPGVHGRDRHVTRTVRKFARSPLSSVSRPGAEPTPQALRENVADAVAYLALSHSPPPAVVSHPWEGLTTSELLRLLGGREPRNLPPGLCRLAVRFGKLVGRAIPFVAANTRRFEVLWFGQRQVGNWLEQSGWTPPVGREGWTQLASPSASEPQVADRPPKAGDRNEST